MRNVKLMLVIVLVVIVTGCTAMALKMASSEQLLKYGNDAAQKAVTETKAALNAVKIKAQEEIAAAQSDVQSEVEKATAPLKKRIEQLENKEIAPWWVKILTAVIAAALVGVGVVVWVKIPLSKVGPCVAGWALITGAALEIWYYFGYWFMLVGAILFGLAIVFGLIYAVVKLWPLVISGFKATEAAGAAAKVKAAAEQTAAGVKKDAEKILTKMGLS